MYEAKYVTKLSYCNNLVFYKNFPRTSNKILFRFIKTFSSACKLKDTYRLDNNFWIVSLKQGIFCA